jgi:hypothetical protein
MKGARLMIPKLSAPLVKDIRTGEGILEWVLAAGDAAAGVTGNLSIGHTVLYGTIIAAMKGTRRVLIKVLAGQAAAGVAAPIAFAPAGLTSDKVLAEIAAVAQATGLVQSKPGTPADQVTVGLSADPAPADATAPAKP